MDMNACGVFAVDAGWDEGVRYNHVGSPDY
jgi:hypothetical protein